MFTRAVTGSSAFLVALAVCVVAAPSAKASTPIAAGDLLAGDYGGSVNHYSSDGTLLASIPVGVGLESGACQDNNSGYVYQTNDLYSPGGTITRIAPDGTVSDTTWASGLSLPESCAVEPNGDVLVGQQTGPVVALGSPSSNSPGSVVATYFPGGGGSSWISLDSDNCTLNVADQSPTIRKYNICTNSPAGSLMTSSGAAYQNEPMPNGDLLVAAGSDVEEVNSFGVVRTYTVPGSSGLTSLAIAADGNSFWVGDHGSGQISRISLSTRSVIQTLSQPGSGAGGLLVYGGPPPPPTCPSLMFFGVRGSGETASDGGGYGTTVQGFEQRLASMVPGLSAEPIDYPAVAVGYDGPFYYIASTYKNSVAAGENQLQSALIDFWFKCPHTYVMLAGYSQGAQVAGDVADTLQKAQRAHIAAVALFGDPRFNPHQSKVDVPDTGYDSKLSGIYQWADKQMRQVPSDLVPRFHSYCLGGDPICNYTKTYALTCALYSSLCPHLEYQEFGYPSDAADWAIGVWKTLPKL